MAKIHPQTSVKGSDHSTSERETFTIWMKSLVFHGNGCTVFNSKGEVVFRVDNYQTRHSSEVFLMDFNGEVLFSMKRKVIKKQSLSGVPLGDDVLTLVLEPQMDYSLVMAL
ncbi:protein LURP-one-related 11-like, partial [Olea europaea var. sylvestris]|uniref:protein LURP-one-related 11-like n=1 Tax=Olea europaea var. sylvestris TaxID=158386 RepID=UPI000C1D4EDA